MGVLSHQCLGECGGCEQEKQCLQVESFVSEPEGTPPWRCGVMCWTRGGVGVCHPRGSEIPLKFVWGIMGVLGEEQGAVGCVCVRAHARVCVYSCVFL